MHQALPSFQEVEAAAARLHGIAHRTPVMRSRQLDAGTGTQWFFKCENLQRMGAFKFRGGYNSVAQFTPEQRQRGVLAFSSGNHAQAIALSAQLLGIPAAIVMPSDAPAAKIAATRGYGAEVITYDRFSEDREAISQRIAAERGMTLIPPYNHPHVIAGQGTAALELLQDVPDLDYLFVCLGGGGLLSGSLLAEKECRTGDHFHDLHPTTSWRAASTTWMNGGSYSGHSSAHSSATIASRPTSRESPCATVFVAMRPSVPFACKSEVARKKK